MSTQTPRHKGARSDYPQAFAFSVRFGRNQVVQTLGISMVALVGLGCTPWPYVLAWTIAIATAAGVEDYILRRVARDNAISRSTQRLASVLRVTITTIYALAALVLIARGAGGPRLFAFALMSASMVHVLMRYYRSPAMLIASLTPYILIFCFLGFGLTRTALAHGEVLAALAPVFTIATFAVQFWSARGQLSAVWTELMTAREAAEERERIAEAANRAKSQFLATMSHELRTPLHGVLGMAQALTRDSLTQTQQERVSIIRRSSESLLAVLNDLLDLAKIEASTHEIETVEFDLGELVRSVVAAYAPLGTKNGVAFVCEVAPEAVGRYLGDAGCIRRVLAALCDNAVKFTHAGCITVRAGRVGERVVFQVTDTGIGIGEEDLQRLFEHFFQADATLSRRYSGAGVGLAICAELARLMGGAIEAASELGSGSTFTLSLPLEAAASAAASPTPDIVAERADVPRVLAAEDNPTNQIVLKTLMGAAGIEPAMVGDGRQALEAWETQSWDIILMDIQMPEMNGVDATRAIRRRERETGRARTPIVAVTANAMTDQVAEYEAAGMDGVVAKPFDIAALLGAMDRAMAAPPTPAGAGLEAAAAG